MSGTSFIMNAHVGRTMADDWHALRAEAVLQRLDSSPLGLTSREASQRLSRFGPNELVQTARVSPLRILLSQFVDVLVIVLIIAAVISATLGLLQGETADLYDAVLIVVIGMSTQLGKIAGLVQQETKEETPLQKQLDRLGRQIGVAVLFAAGLIFVIGVLRDPGHVELLFLTAVGLSVAAIPEGLPAIVTISLALGLQRMIRRGALIRKLPAVEALGAASVICSDKTGTLTKGEMNVRVLVVGAREYEAVGEGFDPSGLVRTDGRVVSLDCDPGVQRLLVCGALTDVAVLKS